MYEAPTPIRLWTVREVASFLDVPVSRLYTWRYLECGPKAYQVGKHLRYDPDEVWRWLDIETADEQG